MNSLSKLYSNLTENIPQNLRVIDLIQADGWTLVESELGVGIALSYRGGCVESLKRDWIGSSLHDLASQVNSWNFPQASLGLAAINAYWNTESVLQEKFGLDTLKSPSDLISKLNAEQINGSSVASIGHFPFLDKLHEQVTIFEMNPKELNELPASAAGYLLPKYDIVLITASAIINKTFEPLSKLSKNSEIWLLGPSTTFNAQFRAYGTNYLGGIMVKDKSTVKNLVRSGLTRELIKSEAVQKIQLKL